MNNLNLPLISRDELTDQDVVLVCVKEKYRLKVQIADDAVNSAYKAGANVRFPKNLRVEGKEYVVKSDDLEMLTPEERKPYYSLARDADIRVLES